MTCDPQAAADAVEAMKLIKTVLFGLLGMAVGIGLGDIISEINYALRRRRRGWWE